MRLLLLIVAFLTLTSSSSVAQKLVKSYEEGLKDVYDTRRQPSTELRARVYKSREELIVLALKGVNKQGDIPVLLGQHGIDSLRAAEVWVVDMDSLSTEILALYSNDFGKSVILVSSEALEYQQTYLDDIIMHEYIHCIDKLLGDRIKSVLNEYTSSDFKGTVQYSSAFHFREKIMRDSIENINIFIEQADLVTSLTAYVYGGTDEEIMVRYHEIYPLRMRDPLYMIWDRSQYSNSDTEVFTRYIMLKRWLVQHKQLSSIYEPVTKNNILYLLRTFPYKEGLATPYESNLSEQQFNTLLYFMDYNKMSKE